MKKRPVEKIDIKDIVKKEKNIDLETDEFYIIRKTKVPINISKDNNLIVNIQFKHVCNCTKRNKSKSFDVEIPNYNIFNQEKEIIYKNHQIKTIKKVEVKCDLSDFQFCNEENLLNNKPPEFVACNMNNIRAAHGLRNALYEPRVKTYLNIPLEDEFVIEKTKCAKNRYQTGLSYTVYFNLPRFIIRQEFDGNNASSYYHSRIHGHSDDISKTIKYLHKKGFPLAITVRKDNISNYININNYNCIFKTKEEAKEQLPLIRTEYELSTCMDTITTSSKYKKSINDKIFDANILYFDKTHCIEYLLSKQK